MKIAYKHLIKSINNPPEIGELSDKFFQLGHEHDIKNNVFDFELTPNRGDCLSLRGMLRELNAFYEVNINRDIYNNDIKELKINFTNNLTDFCPNISFLKLDIDKIPQSYSGELKDYFDDFNLKKINFFTDISNFILYEIGQPTHCYENKNFGKKIDLSNLKSKTKFVTLLDKIIELNPGDPVFFNNKNEIINLAGIMGGKNTACSKKTNSVLIECAYFIPEMIIGKTVKYSLKSEAAYRFERNTDPSIHNYTLRRFLKIVQENTNILNVEKFSQEYETINDNSNLSLDIEKINRILGTSLDKKTINNYLENLGFVVSGSEIIIPDHRHDISSLNDIAEEVARVFGYNNIESKAIEINSKNNLILNEKDIKIKTLLIDNGFFEVINNPFVSFGDDFSLSVDNPLDSNRKYLRTNLKNSLLDNLTYNERRQKDSVKLFEISDIYTANLKSKKAIGIIASGRIGKNYLDFTKKINKQYLNDIFDNYLINNDLEPFKFEIISRDGLNSKNRDPIFYSEIEIDLIENFEYRSIEIKNNSVFKYVPISDLPFSSRDLSFSITHHPSSMAVQDFILNYKDPLLKDVFVFDYFFNEKNNEIKIGFRFSFQDSKSTITEEQVNLVMDAIIENTTKLNGVKIPGLINDKL